VEVAREVIEAGRRKSAAGDRRRLSSAKVGWFNWQTKTYETAAELQEQLEVLSLIGDIALKDGKPVVHAHLIVGRKDGTAHGGHLLLARWERGEREPAGAFATLAQRFVVAFETAWSPVAALTA